MSTKEVSTPQWNECLWYSLQNAVFSETAHLICKPNKVWWLSDWEFKGKTFDDIPGSSTNRGGFPRIWLLMIWVVRIKRRRRGWIRVKEDTRIDSLTLIISIWFTVGNMPWNFIRAFLVYGQNSIQFSVDLDLDLSVVCAGFWNEDDNTAIRDYVKCLSKLSSCSS